MKCMSCNEVVDPKFAHAISKNECPMCGNVILTEKLRTVLTDLKMVMDDAIEFPEEVADWFWSNYQMKKIDQSATKSNHIDLKGQGDLETQTVEGQTVFAKRAGVKIKPVRDRSDFANVIDQITSDKTDTIEQPKTIEQLEAELPFNNVSRAPLNVNEHRQLFDVFDNDMQDNQVLELEKLKQLRKQNMGAEPKIKRRD
jgi:hypothetical protein